MPALQVRDFPQDLYEELKDCASREHRSLAQQTIYAVEEMLARRGTARHDGARASLVDSFDSPRARQDRIAKRQALFVRIEQYAERFPKDLPSPEEMAREGHEELERRADRTIALVDGNALVDGDAQ